MLPSMSSLYMRLSIEIDELKSFVFGCLSIISWLNLSFPFIEGELTARIGDAGKRLHTARSRNDQVALDVRLTLRKECAGLMEQLKELINVLCDQAEEYADTVMPGYTHLQRAQPITFGHHLMAYAVMFLRDIGRMQDALQTFLYSSIGSVSSVRPRSMHKATSSPVILYASRNGRPFEATR